MKLDFVVYDLYFVFLSVAFQFTMRRRLISSSLSSPNNVLLNSTPRKIGTLQSGNRHSIRNC